MAGTAERSDPGSTTTPPGGGTLSHLPWGMIPAFKPGETDINEYTKKLEFLANLWPVEHLNQLAPRAALLCEGSAFKRIMRIETSKLKVNSTDGVKALVTALGGIWGRSKMEDKFERFEKAIFGTCQKGDETNESYLARHDHQFEELLSMGTTIAEMRAYILLRNSGLGAEDKKKLIIDSKGILAYDDVVAAMKLLGSKFFQEVQTGGRVSSRTKTYDANTAVSEDSEAPAETAGAEDESILFGEMLEDGLFAV